MQKNIKKYTVMAILSALSVVLALLIRFPIFPMVPFLEYEPGDIPIIFSSFIFGPISGLVVTLLVSIIQGFTVSAGSGIIGVIMHTFATGALALTTGFIYKKLPNTKGLILSVVLGTLVMTITMLVWNLLITPVFLGSSLQDVLGIIMYIIGFNFIKALANTTFAALLFKSLSKFLKSRNMLSN